jgi:hypothetical protein
MAKSFAITTTATAPLKADAKGHTQVVFTVTNTSARPVRGLGKVKPLGDTKREWLRLEGEAERDFAAGATQQFTVNFAGPSTPAAGKPGAGTTESTAAAPAPPPPPPKYPFRLDLVSAQNPDEDFTEGPVVTVEMMPAPVVNGGGSKWWILILIAAVVLIGIIVLVIVLVSGRRKKPVTNGHPSPTPVETATATPKPTENPEVVEKRCFDLVQGKIAWNYSGSTTWAPNNVQNLCKGTSDADQPPRCFQRVMHGGINNGAGTQWIWQNASKLCAGTNDADKTISCFQAKIAAGNQMAQAIDACNGK